jgi:RNA polymerase sigma factor (sigma-70 family)
MITEEEIIRLIRSGGKETQAGCKALYDNHAQHMLSFFIKRGRVSIEEAWDVLQETVVNIVRGATNFSGEEKAKAWIWRIARNCLIDHFRKHSRYKDALREHEEQENFFSGYQSKDESRGRESTENDTADLPSDVEKLDEVTKNLDCEIDPHCQKEKDPSQKTMYERDVENVRDNENDDREVEKGAFIMSNNPRAVADCVCAGLEAFSKEHPLRVHVLEMKMDGVSDKEISIKIGRTLSATREYLSQCRKKFEPFIIHCKGLLSS